jgi:hypothetical protein
MAKIILNAYSAKRSGAFVSIALCIGGEPPFPRKEVEITRALDAAIEFQIYKLAAQETGKPLAVSMMMARGERSPKGFKNLPGASGQPEYVNL